jgi:hypothetical protein
MTGFVERFGHRLLCEVSMHSQLRHYTSQLQYSPRLRYRTARLLAIWLPLALFLYALMFVVAAHGT